MNIPISPLPIPELLAPEDRPHYDVLVTEDDTPVDNIFSEKQQRLLTEPLYSSWAGPGEGRPFLALANVGLFYAEKQPPLVPDMMLSLDARPAADIWEKRNRSYFIWVFGKAPEVVVEVVSNREGGEADDKLRTYARMGVPYYVIVDPNNELGGGVLRAFGLHRRSYEPIAVDWLPDVGLGLKLWRGAFEGWEAEWLRWCDRQGQFVPTGHERAEQERQRAEQERQRAEQERQRAERLAEQLRAHGIEPAP